MSLGHNKPLRWLVWPVLFLVLLEAASCAALRVASGLSSDPIRTTSDIYQEQSARIRVLLTPDPTRMVVVDSLLGWRYRAGRRDSANETNLSGLRSRREYSLAPRRGVLRVAAFGDSFVYGNEVVNEAAWSAVLERVHPEIEVLNYGVGGYGVDQAFLRYLQEGKTYAPHVVIMGFATDDMTRVTNVYRRFRSNQEIPLAKPRYTLGEDGSLRLIPTPIKRLEDYHRYLDDPSRVTELGANDDWYQPAVYRDPLYDYSATLRLLTQVWIVGERRFGAARILQEGEFNPESPAFRIQLKLFEAFSDSVRSRGAWPLIVLFPDQGSIAAARAGKGTVLSSLAAALREQHLDFVDLTDAFREAKSERVGRWFMPAGHYSAEANQVVAFWLGSHLPSVN